MIVRRVTGRDIPQVLALAEAFHVESPEHRDNPFDPIKVETLIRGVMFDGRWLALVAVRDDGTVAGGGIWAVEETYYGPALEVLDLALFVDSSRRGTRAFSLLITAVREWARSKGARLTVGVRTGIEVERAERAFLHAGFRRSGSIFTIDEP